MQIADDSAEKCLVITSRVEHDRQDFCEPKCRWQQFDWKQQRHRLMIRFVDLFFRCSFLRNLPPTSCYGHYSPLKLQGESLGLYLVCRSPWRNSLRKETLASDYNRLTMFNAGNELLWSFASKYVRESRLRCGLIVEFWGRDRGLKCNRMRGETFVCSSVKSAS